MMNLFKNNINLRFLVFLLPVPLIINNLINFLSGRFYFGFQNTSGIVEVFNILISFFMFLFYLYFGKLLQKIFKTEYLTSSIIVFWLILFGIDNTLLIFTKHISFQLFVFLIFVFTIIFLIVKKLKFQYFIKLTISFVLLKTILILVQHFYIDPIISLENLFTSDEQILWYPALQGIFDKNYYALLTNNPFPGYGLFTAYVGALNSFMLIGFDTFQYYLAINYLFIFLFFTFIYEISKSKKSFIFLSVLFLSVILSSHWFTYVFFGSLLSRLFLVFVLEFCLLKLLTGKTNKIFTLFFYFFLLDLSIFLDNLFLR